MLDVVDVCRSLLHIRVIHLGEDLRLVVKRNLDRIFRRVLLCFDNLIGRINQIIVLKHHRVHREHLRAVLAGVNDSLFVKRILLLDGAPSRVLKTCKLALDVINQAVVNFKLWRLIHLDLSDRDAV